MSDAAIKLAGDSGSASTGAVADAVRQIGQKYGLYILGFASLFVIWHLASIYLVRSVLFPPPIPVLQKAGVLISTGVLFEQVSASLQRIVIGFLLGSGIGVLVGLLIGSFRAVQRLLDPYIETLRFIPAVAMITVAVIWFGIGEASKVFIITYSTVFIVIITTAAGVSGITPNKIRAARSLGATRLQIFVFVTLPATVPFILTGMRVAMANAFTTIVAAELVAANQGIGTLLWNARLFMLVEDIFVALLTLAILGFVIDRCFRWAIFTFAGKYSPLT
jgi:ABC-type nitrate/sulfonate/bicarbonate transport system permease component